MDDGYRRGAVCEVEDEIETLDLVMFEAGVVGRYGSASESLWMYRARGDLWSPSGSDSSGRNVI